MIFDEVRNKDWDSIHLGMFQENIFESPVTQWITGYRQWNEPLSQDIIDHISKYCGPEMAYRTKCLAGCEGPEKFNREKRITLKVNNISNIL